MFARKLLLLLFASMPIGLPAQTNDSGAQLMWGLSAGFNRDPVLGVATSGFLARQVRSPVLPIRSTVAIDFIFSEDEDSPYYRDGDICRDSRDGTFAESSNCGPEIDLAVRAEVVGIIAGRVGIGGGARLGTTLSPYGLVHYALPAGSNTFWFGQLSVGDHFTQLDVGIAMPL